MVLIDFFNSYVFYETAVDIHFEGFGDVSLFVITDDKGDLILIRLRQPELFVKILIGVYTLIQGGAILVFYDNAEFIGSRVTVGNIE